MILYKQILSLILNIQEIFSWLEFIFHSANNVTIATHKFFSSPGGPDSRKLASPEVLLPPCGPRRDGHIVSRP